MNAYDPLPTLLIIELPIVDSDVNPEVDGGPICAATGEIEKVGDTFHPTNTHRIA